MLGNYKYFRNNTKWGDGGSVVKKTVHCLVDTGKCMLREARRHLLHVPNKLTVDIYGSKIPSVFD